MGLWRSGAKPAADKVTSVLNEMEGGWERRWTDGSVGPEWRTSFCMMGSVLILITVPDQPPPFASPGVPVCPVTKRFDFEQVLQTLGKELRRSVLVCVDESG